MAEVSFERGREDARTSRVVEALRREIVDAYRRSHALGLSRGTSGNVSARAPGGLLITPSALPPGEVGPDDVVWLPSSEEGAGEPGSHRASADATGVPGEAPAGATPAPGQGAPASRRPSSEWRLHAAILAHRPDVSAVVHVHPPFATALACHRRGIPAFHYMVAVAGGDSIRCAPYATFGTEELARAAVAALEVRRACLLAHHGLVAVGASPGAALELALAVETLAEQYWRALQLGEPPVLDAEEMARVVERFREYRRETA